MSINLVNNSLSAILNSNDEVSNKLNSNKDLKSLDDKFIDYQNELNRFNQTNGSSLSLSELMGLLDKIIKASQELYSQLLNNRVSEASSTINVAKALASIKKDDAQRKFSISLGAGVVSMGLTTVATMKGAKFKTVQDKHLVQLNMGKNAKVSNLSSDKFNELSANLQQKRTAKYNMVSQLSNSSKETLGDVNEVQNADAVKQQEEIQAVKEMKKTFDNTLSSYIDSLTSELERLIKLKDSAQSTAAVTNR